MRTLLLFISLIVGISAFAADPVCVTAERANLRAGPGADKRVTWQVGKFMPLVVMSEQNGWFQVKDVDGEMHWISSNLVSGGGHCLVVSARVAILRRAAGAKSLASDIPFAEKYTTFRKIGREDEWIQVMDPYREKFWINEKLVWAPLKNMRLNL